MVLGPGARPVVTAHVSAWFEQGTSNLALQCDGRGDGSG
jgi:hypothetical protein